MAKVKRQSIIWLDETHITEIAQQAEIWSQRVLDMSGLLEPKA